MDGADAAAAAADAKAVAADAKAAAADAKAVEADAKAVAAKDAIPAARNEKAEWLWDGHAGDYDQSMVAKLGPCAQCAWPHVVDGHNPFHMG